MTEEELAKAARIQSARELIKSLAIVDPQTGDEVLVVRA
jgi:hypothetical protein